MTELPPDALIPSRPGPAPLEIPAALIGMLDLSHRSGRPAWVILEGEPDQEDSRELIRLARVHCRRVDKSLRISEKPLTGGRIRIELLMRDKRRPKGSTS